MKGVGGNQRANYQVQTHPVGRRGGRGADDGCGRRKDGSTGGVTDGEQLKGKWKGTSLGSILEEFGMFDMRQVISSYVL